jgi:hypothetical protein
MAQSLSSGRALREHVGAFARPTLAAYSVVFLIS